MCEIKSKYDNITKSALEFLDKFEDDDTMQINNFVKNKCVKVYCNINSMTIIPQSVELISYTKPAKSMTLEQLIAYTARVSSDRSNKTEQPEKLLGYMLRNKHWSPFEMVNICFEITTSRAIGRQLLRHDMGFQELSQRYKELDNTIIEFDIRMSGDSNRQGSRMPNEKEYRLIEMLRGNFMTVFYTAFDVYQDAIASGVAPECARVLLPEQSATVIYANTTLRNWLTFLNVRLERHAQKEMREIANMIADRIALLFPTVYSATNNFNDHKGLFM